jgi:hypothetical protein
MKKLRNGFLALSIVFVLTTCSGGGGDPVRVSFHLQRPLARGVLPNVADYPCFGLVVTGEGIPSLQPGTGNRFPADHCPYAGAASVFVPLNTSSAVPSVRVEALVPPGRNRLIQVVAVEQNGAMGCPSGTVSEFIRRSNLGTGPVGFGGMYEVGYKVADLFADAEIQVPKIYDAGTAQNLRGCSAGSLSISPSGIGLVAARETMVDFKGVGGVPPYIYSMTGAGSLDSATGLFYAPSVGGQTATITVTDSVGAAASTSVTSYKPATEPWAWYMADQFTGTSAPITGPWGNINSGAPSLNPAGSGTATFVPRALNGFPVVRLEDDRKFIGVLGTGLAGGVHALLVARILHNAQTGSLFCLAANGCGNALGFMKLLGGATFSAFALNGSFSSSLSGVAAPNGFFIAQLGGDLTSSSLGIVLKINGGTATDGSNPAGTLAFNLSGSSTLTLGPYDSSFPLDVEVAEFIVELSSVTLTPQPGLYNYLKAKYQL